MLQAIALVDEETRRYRPTKNYLDYLPPANYSAFEVCVCIHVAPDRCIFQPKSIDIFLTSVQKHILLMIFIRHTVFDLITALCAYVFSKLLGTLSCGKIYIFLLRVHYKKSE